MKHFVVGTAGHIDHGKTTLVKALTGIDCDRLKEEKERGITIDLGFAFFDLPSGRRAGIVDVPGHEKFIKNMLAGVGGIDLVLWIVAADEGIMPQSAEHLAILSILQVERGVVVITKKDLVEPDWLELVMLDVKERVQGTFLADAPIIPVSALTGEGLPELAAQIDRLADGTTLRDHAAAMRLPIDRVFSVQGFGTVVTGTLHSGVVTVGDTLEIFPGQLMARVRGVGVHGQKVNAAVAGQRTAINLAGVQVEQLRRGDVLATPKYLSPSLMLDVRLTLLSDAEKILGNRERMRLYTGAAEVLCRVVLLDQEALAPGDSALAQLRLEEPLAVMAGDRFVLRTYSPMSTIGGGSIIDPLPIKRKRFKERGLAELWVLEKGGTEEVIVQVLRKTKNEMLTREELLRTVYREDKAEALEKLLAADAVHNLRVDDVEYLVDALTLQAIEKKVSEELASYHRRFPLRSGIAREELRSKVMPGAHNRLFASLLLLLQGSTGHQGGARHVAGKDFKVEFVGKWAQRRSLVLELLAAALFSPPSTEELAIRVSLSLEDLKELQDALAERGEIIKVAEGAYFHALALRRAKVLLLEFFQKEEELSLAAFRTMIDSSRKYALLLLEYFDQHKLTVRSGETRRRHSAFDSAFLS
ncbi:MAG: Selenocysteine-specific elongation factor [Firmicutes bacterium]|nr:Selenocysteine-specific elongation factor [Bacillota bacterium]